MRSACREMGSNIIEGGRTTNDKAMTVEFYTHWRLSKGAVSGNFGQLCGIKYFDNRCYGSYRRCVGTQSSL